MKRLGKILAIFFGCSCAAQTISVNDNYTAQQLVTDVLVNSPCVQIANVNVSGWAFSSGNSYGYFNANGSSLPFADGVLLTTGAAMAAIGPNSGIVSDGPSNWAGDPDLEQALNLNNTLNATVLEFDFVSVSNRFSFDYIFASEQYLSNPSQNQCGYTDGFAFLLRKAGSANPYENLALVPDSSIPVTVNTVRGPGTICPSSNEEYFDAFNPYDHPTNYNGQTKILTASANIIAGEWYHLKIVIADQGNELYDSAVFLGGGSFKAEKDLGPDRLLSQMNALCPAASHVLDATMAGAVAYRWFKDGALLPTETNATYTVTESGIYSVEIDLAGSCTATGEVELDYFAPFQIPDPQVYQCAGPNNEALVDLPLLLGEISNVGSIGGAAVFYPTMADALNSTNPISTSSQYVATLPTTVFVALTRASCTEYASFDLDANTANLSPVAISVCDEDGTQDGITSFGLDLEVSPQLLASVPPNFQVRYYASEPDAALQQNPLASTYLNSGPNETIYARIASNSACFDIVPVTLDVSFFNASSFADETVAFCSGNSALLQAPAGFANYTWSNGDTGPTTVATQTGAITVTVENAAGCLQPKTFHIQVSEPATYEGVDLNQFNGDENSVTILYSGNGSYEFSLNGQSWQASNVFHHVAVGYHQVYIRDLAGCQLSGPFEIFVSGYPKFFTPNGDGINDFWNVTVPDAEAQARVFIFDRYGKLIAEMRASGSGWNGKSNSRELPSADYWFALELSGGHVVKGHFSLKR